MSKNISVDNKTRAHINKTLKDAEILLLNKNRLSFFGSQFCFYEKKIGQIAQNPDLIPLVFTEFKDKKFILHFNNPTDVSLSKFIGSVVHEMFHIVSRHIKYFTDKDKEILWNMAADHVVKRDMEKVTSKLIEGAKHLPYFDKIERKIPGASVEKVYQELLKDKEELKYKIKSLDDDQEILYANIKYTDIYGKEYQFKGVILDVNFNNRNENPELSEEELEILRSRAQRSHSIMKGDLPLGISEVLDNIFKVEIPWNIITEDAIIYECNEEQGRSWTQPNIVLRHLKLPGPSKDFKPR
ncbi:MAG: DUF2201 family putative metallopeptidase, partial [archaeon]